MHSKFRSLSEKIYLWWIDDDVHGQQYENGYDELCEFMV